VQQSAVVSLLRVTSRPAWRRPVKAARTVCGSQPSRCPISATEAPSGRSSMPISTARFVLARGRSASGILAIAKLTPSTIRSDCEAGSSGGGVVFFDRPMLLEVPLEAAAPAAASPVWVAVDFDRACRVRRRGVRWRSRAGWFASPISDFSALFACLRGCLLAIVFILWIRIALRDACTTTSPALGARRAATQEGAVDMDSNASRAGEVERKVWRDNDFLLPGKASEKSPLVDGQSAVSTLRKWGQRRRVATGIRATALLAERASQYLVIVSPPFTERCAFGLMFRRRSGISEQHPWHSAVLDGVSVRCRSTASSFRFWGSATSRRLGRVTVLPQLKVDRLCSVVDSTAEFDPKPTVKVPRRSVATGAQPTFRSQPVSQDPL